ncbi:MAG: putative peptidoglycan lipid II flippase [Gammaproteobacteria bacterium]|jgi:putative peptidoglycan lipid II flippase
MSDAPPPTPVRRPPRSAPKGRSLLRSTSTVGANTLLSRILGFVRDVVIAATFGAGSQADAFFVAFRIPNLFRRLFAEGAFSQAFVPVLSAERSQNGDEAVRDLAAHVAGALSIVLAVFTVIGVVAAPLLVWMFAPGFHDQGDKFDLTVQMLRICFPYLLFISLTSLSAAILNTYGRFAIPAFTPVLLNVCLIAATVLIAPRLAQPVLALAAGVFVAGIAQLLFQLPFLLQIGMLVRPRWSLAHAGMRKVATLIVPALFGVSVTQINILVNTLIASFLAAGSVSWLYYSDRIVEFPLGVFGIALATVILPKLSREHASGDPRVFSQTLDWALRLVCVLSIPAAVGIALLAGPMLCTLFQYGAFTVRDVDLASASLMAFALGLPGFVGVKVLATGYFSRQDMRTPVRIAAIAVLANLGINLLLVGSLAHAGLALGTAGAALLNAGLLYKGLHKARVHRPEAGWRRLLLQVLVANIAMVVFLLLLRGEMAQWFNAGAMRRALSLSALIGGAALVYALVLLLVGVRPRDLLTPVRR